MIDRNKIAAVVILYNPPDDCAGGIELYRSDVETVYAVDNSGTPDPSVALRLKSAGNVVYLQNGKNLGVARALNMAAERAVREGYDFLLTMDQDSRVRPGMVAALLACAEQAGIQTVGIISPVHQYPYSVEGWSNEPCQEVLTVMTSGNLLNLNAYRAVGPFQDDFFIDHVDDEYCLRLNQRGYKVILANTAVLEHRLGAGTEHRFLWKKFSVSHHAPIRKYYGIRNRFYLRREYGKLFPRFFRFFYLKLAREIATVILYERDTREKLSMMLKGYRDFKRGIAGGYRER